MEKELTLYDQQSTDVLTQAEAMVVEDKQQYDVASAWTKACIDLKKKIVAFFEPMKMKAHEAHQTVCDSEKKHLGPVEKAVGVLKKKMTSWYMEEQRKVREQEEKIRQEAIRQQEEARLKEAEELEKNGEAEKAEEILAAPILAPVFKPQEIEKPEGVSYRDSWKFEITDESKIPREYLIPDEKKIAGIVKAMKEKFDVPGIRAYNDPIQVNRI